MISQIILIVGSSLIAFSEAGNTTITSKNSTNKCVPVTRMKSSVDDGSVCIPYGLDQDLFENGGYCKHVLGNLPVFGNIYELDENEKKIRRFEVVKHLLEGPHRNSKSKQWINRGKFFEVRQSCLKMVDDIYCHHYFKRCYISSKPQPVCREACEELMFKVCDREVKVVSEFNRDHKLFQRLWPYTWDLINCTTLPSWNESSNCYYPDKIREKLNVLEKKECFYGDGRGYRGNMSTTVSGYACQRWNAQCPHKHNINGDMYEEIRNSSNFCRNPGGFSLKGPWCFTTNRTVRWEFCNVSTCAKEPPSSPPADFRGHNSSSTSIQIFWGDVPKPSVNGILLGFHAACERHNSSDKHFKVLGTGERHWEFKGLEKYMNYSCYLRAFNSFGNGNWSEELVISTDEDVPGAPPESLKAWNLSSTSVHVQWEPIPAEERHGKILGYQVEIKAEQDKSGRSKPTTNYTNARSLEFSGLKKYSKYAISVCALTRRGRGPTCALSVQTDEDVPERPPTEISVVSLGTNMVLVNWSPVPREYTNGKVLGYKVLYGHINDTSHANITVADTRKQIDGLKSNTNYSFQLLAFTAKGDGAISTNYFAKTNSDPVNGGHYKPPSSATGTRTIIMAAVFTSIVAFGAVFLVIHFVRKRRSLSANDGTTVGCTPYAISPADWLQTIIAASHAHGYETLDDDNVPDTSRQPLYINIAPDGSLDLPEHLRNIVLEFEQSYENTHYKRLNRRRRSLGGAVDDHGRPIYDNLQRVISPTAADQRKSFNQEASRMIAGESSKEHTQHHSIDLGELERFVQTLQGDLCSIDTMDMPGMGRAKSSHRRRFSVDLGEVREFIALREIRASAATEGTALDDEQADVQEEGQNNISC